VPRRPRAAPPPRRIAPAPPPNRARSPASTGRRWPWTTRGHRGRSTFDVIEATTNEAAGGAARPPGGWLNRTIDRRRPRFPSKRHVLVPRARPSRRSFVLASTESNGSARGGEASGWKRPQRVSAGWHRTGTDGWFGMVRCVVVMSLQRRSPRRSGLGREAENPSSRSRPADGPDTSTRAFRRARTVPPGERIAERRERRRARNRTRSLERA
jgi:hypothetical protein